MRFHYQYTFLLMCGIILVGVVLGIVGNRGNTSRWYVPFDWRKRSSFSATGWRYRNASICCSYLAIAVVAADLIFGSFDK
jgi:hypothetical protein